MVSKQETARALLTPGEVMQLPPADELVLVSGLAPIRAKKLRYYADRNFIARVMAAPTLGGGSYRDRPAPRPDDWSGQVCGLHVGLLDTDGSEAIPAAVDEGGLRKQLAPKIGKDPLTSILVGQNLDQTDDDDGDSSVDGTVPDSRALNGLGRARAMNDGNRDLDNDILPSF